MATAKDTLQPEGMEPGTKEHDGQTGGVCQGLKDLEKIMFPVPGFFSSLAQSSKSDSVSVGTLQWMLPFKTSDDTDRTT